MLIIIDNYDSFTYNLYQCVANKIDTRVFRNDKINIAEIKALNPSGIILSPGPGRPETAGICIPVIQQLAHEIPILGICLGHQAIGVAFGANVVQHHEIIHGKASTVHHIDNELFTHLPTTFQAGRYHSLVIELASIPADLSVTAICHDSSVMAVKHAAYPCYGVQFHPESILTENGNVLLNNFVTICQEHTLRKNNVTTINQQAYAA